MGPAPGYRAPVPPARAAWRRLHLDPIFFFPGTTLTTVQRGDSTGVRQPTKLNQKQEPPKPGRTTDERTGQPGQTADGTTATTETNRLRQDLKDT